MEKRIYLKSPRKDLNGLELTCTVKDADDRGMANRAGRSIHPIDGRDDLLVKFIPLAEREKIEKLIEIGLRIENEEKNSVLTKAFPLASAYNSEDNAEGTWCGFVMENCKDDCSLNKYLCQYDNERLLGKEHRYAKMIGICYRLCHCFQLLHERGLLVSDMKPDNFFVTGNGEVYPIDLDGFSVDGSCSQPPHSCYYMNGEIPESPFVPTQKSEDHGLAMLLFQVLTCTPHLNAQLRFILGYDLEKGKEYEQFRERNGQQFHHAAKEIFYSSWYTLPDDIQQVFLRRLFKANEVMPSPKEWMGLFVQFMNRRDIYGKGFPPIEKREEPFTSHREMPDRAVNKVATSSHSVSDQSSRMSIDRPEPHRVPDQPSPVTPHVTSSSSTEPGWGRIEIRPAPSVEEDKQPGQTTVSQGPTEPAPVVSDHTVPPSISLDWEQHVSEGRNELPSVPQDTGSERIWPYVLAGLLAVTTAILLFVLMFTTR